MNARVTGFGPVVFPDSRVLIMGSFPSVASRAEGFYYGNPRNRFWHTVCGFFGEAAPVSIEGKTAFLRRRAIALWDTVVSCEIAGSADASIRYAEIADVPALLRQSAVRAVLCNGKTAYTLLRGRHAALPVPVVLLPSTSPANPRFCAGAWHEALRLYLCEGEPCSVTKG